MEEGEAALEAILRQICSCYTDVVGQVSAKQKRYRMFLSLLQWIEKEKHKSQQKIIAAVQEKEEIETVQRLAQGSLDQALLKARKSRASMNQLEETKTAVVLPAAPTSAPRDPIIQLPIPHKLRRMVEQVLRLADTRTKQPTESPAIVYGLRLDQSLSRRLRPLATAAKPLSFAKQIVCLEESLQKLHDIVLSALDQSPPSSSEYLRVFPHWYRLNKKKIAKVLAELQDELSVQRNIFPVSTQLSSVAMEHRDSFLESVKTTMTPQPIGIRPRRVKSLAPVLNVLDENLSALFNAASLTRASKLRLSRLLHSLIHFEGKKISTAISC